MAQNSNVNEGSYTKLRQRSHIPVKAVSHIGTRMHNQTQELRAHEDKLVFSSITAIPDTDARQFFIPLLPPRRPDPALGRE